MIAEPAHRIRLDGEALVANWRWHRDRAGVPAAAAVKADGYGLGARAVVARLAAAGCRTFAVSTWVEAEELGRPPADAAVLVLHGFVPADAAAAVAMPWVRPVLNTAAQIGAWKTAFPERPADLMVDTGMNRLGISPAELGLAKALRLVMVHGHLATADMAEHPMADAQRARFAEVAAATPGVAHALANSAGVCRGRDFSFDLVRPGLGLYGGRAHPAAEPRPVVHPEARVIQARSVPEGDAVGYGATWVAPRPSRIATINLGYADGMLRALGRHLRFRAGGTSLPAVGRISMDLIALDVTGTEVGEGDWVALDFDLPRLEAASGVSQYELLTGLSRRAPRIWS
jgi:alanine racemase